MRKIVKLSLLIMGMAITASLTSRPSDPISIRGVSPAAASDQAANTETEMVILHVDGMTCRSCVKGIRKALLNVPGVKKAHVSFKEAKAEVECDKGKVSDEQLVKAIEGESNLFFTFTAQVVDRKFIPYKEQRRKGWPGRMR